MDKTIQFKFKHFWEKSLSLTENQRTSEGLLKMEDIL